MLRHGYDYAPNGELSRRHALGQAEVHEPSDGSKNGRVLALDRPKPEFLTELIQLD
jgi:hypothetical protein